MSNTLFCEQVVAPGIVVLLLNSGDVSGSTWGVTVPHDYWKRFSKGDVVNRFNQYSVHFPQIPYLEFTGGEEWKLRFGQYPSTVQPLCWLEAFLGQEQHPVPTTLLACSLRDGSRYYGKLSEWLPMLARSASKEFTKNELMRKECYGVQQMIHHGRAILAWRRENPGWKDWKTVYPPESKFHFRLF